MWEVAIALIFVGMAWMFASLALTLDKEHAPLKLLFLLFTFFILILGINVAIKMTTAGTQVYNLMLYTYRPLIYITIFTVFYFVIYFIYKTVLAINIRKEYERESY